MADYPSLLKDLIAALRKLPSMGPRGAERLALHLIESEPSLSHELSHVLRTARDTLRPCARCGFFAEQELCEICRDADREAGVLCVVELATDILKVEKSGKFRGIYHALGGRLSPLDQVGPDQLRIRELLERCRNERPQEVILALGADTEGETTALYLAPLLKETGVRVSRLALGLPAGGGLEHADSVTLGYAVSGRRDV